MGRIEAEPHAIERCIVREGVLAQQRTLRHVVQAGELGGAGGEEGAAVCREGDGAKAAPAGVVLGARLGERGTAARHVRSAVDGASVRRLLGIPQRDGAVEGGGGEQATVGLECDREHVGAMLQRVDGRLGGHKIPHAHRLVPGARREERTACAAATEREA
eukprot:641924-Prymnesium_polylepis.1